MDELIQEKMLEAVNKVSGGVIGVLAVRVDDIINCHLAHDADFLRRRYITSCLKTYWLSFD